MSTGSKRPSYLFLLGAGFIVGIGFWLGSDIFPRLISSDNIWDSILIILGLISILNFLIFFIIALLWHVFLSENAKDIAACKTYKTTELDFVKGVDFRQNVELIIAIWFWLTVIFSGSMIWVFWKNIFPFITHVILSVVHLSFYPYEIITGNENVFQKLLEYTLEENKPHKLLVVWPIVLLGAFILFIKFIIFFIGTIRKSKMK